MARNDTETAQAAIDESDLAEYLRAHPDFFERHREVLLELELSHPVEGKVISLLERQVLALREEHEELKGKFTEVVEHASQNEQLESRLHETALALLRAGRGEDALRAALQELQRGFEIEYVSLRVADAGPALADEWVCAADDQNYRDLLRRVEHGGSICDGRLNAGPLRFLFGEAVHDVRSYALVPLCAPGQRRVAGLLALAASDARRFAPDMGTRYLDRLGELIAAVVTCASAQSDSPKVAS